MHKQIPPNTPGEPSKVLVYALKKILMPLVKLLLSFQITYPYLINLLKSIYVEIAEEEFPVSGKRQSDSRISLLTGVHRKDVKRLRNPDSSDGGMPQNISLGAQLVALWIGSERYQDSTGQPLPLPIKTPPGYTGPTFDNLVETVSKKDLRPRVVLDEWIRLGVTHIEDENVVLNTGAFTPEKGFDEKVFFFGKNLHDHISAGSHNLLGLKPSFFDRSVYYDQLTAESIESLAKLANKLGMDTLRAINQQALTLQNQDSKQENAVHRMNLGIFYYSHGKNSGGTDDNA